MIKNQNIVCIAFPSWEGNYMKSTVELMSVLARENNILYVDYEHTFKDILMHMLGRHRIPVKRILGWENRLRTLELNPGKVHILTPPPILPINWISHENLYRTLLNSNAERVKRAIQLAMAQLGLHNAIVINAFNPFFGLPLLGKLEETLNIYYCYDEITGADWCKVHGGPVEKAFMQEVDAIITSSRGLYERKKAYNPHTYFIKNGVNFDLFHQAFALRNEGAEPKQAPTIGFMGSIDHRVDFELLAYCIQNLPHVRFQFVGRCNHTEGKKQLEKFANVQFLGPKPPNELPYCLKNFHVGIIPFVKNDFTANIYPLKVNEYLASGIPVVSTDFADMQDFERVISIQSDQEGFLEALKKSLEPQTQGITNKRIGIARKNSWENRAEQLSQVVDQALKKKYEAQWGEQSIQRA